MSNNRIPTASKFLDKGNFNNTTDMLIEFAQLHVQEALKAADNNAQVEVVDWDDSGFNLTEPATPIYGVDSASILNAYPLSNIK